MEKTIWMENFGHYKTIAGVMKFGEAGCADSVLSALQGEILRKPNEMRWVVNVRTGIDEARQGRGSGCALSCDRRQLLVVRLLIPCGSKV